jgi:hypothetical protein
MGDPATLPGMLINGVISNRLAKGDIGKGLAINAALFAGAKGLGSLGAMGSSTAGATQAANIAAQPALGYGAANTAAGSAMAAPASSSLMSSLTSGLQSANTFANQNPVTTNIGLQTAGSLLTPPEPLPMAPPPGLMPGQQFQMEQPMYAMSQQQPISLI